MLEEIGSQALLSLVVNLIFLIITWWSLQALRIEAFIKKGNVIQARLILIVLTIAIASLVSEFFLNYLSWSLQIRYLF